MNSKIDWKLETIDNFIISFSANSVNENQSNADCCCNSIRNLVQEIMTMDYTEHLSGDHVLEKTKNNEELFKKFNKLYEKIKKLYE